MKTGIIAGAFDVIHPGYILAFVEAKMNCDRLIVCLHVDPSDERPEKAKPVLRVSERKIILEAIRYVDTVYPYGTEEEFLAILESAKPDVRFLGQDYDLGLKKITGSELNIPIHFLDRSHGWSSTKFKELICASMEKKAPERSTKFVLTEDEWVITDETNNCWRCGDFMPLSKDHLCLLCFGKEKK